MTKYVDGIKMQSIQCANCSVPFALTREFINLRKGDKKTFYCPKGHSQWFPGETREEQIEKQLIETEHRLDQEKGRAKAIARQRDKISKSYGKMRDRVKNGVCPCCNRTFQNLLNHMKSEHPEFGSHQILRSIRDVFGLTQLALGDEVGVAASHISKYELQKHVPDYVQERIQEWMSDNA